MVTKVILDLGDAGSIPGRPMFFFYFLIFVADFFFFYILSMTILSVTILLKCHSVLDRIMTKSINRHSILGFISTLVNP